MKSIMASILETVDREYSASSKASIYALLERRSPVTLPSGNHVVKESNHNGYFFTADFQILHLQEVSQDDFLAAKISNHAPYTLAQYKRVMKR